MADGPDNAGRGSQVLRRANSWLADHREVLGLVAGLVVAILSGWLTYRDVLRDAEATSAVVLPDPTKPGASLSERVKRIEDTRWTPEDEAARDVVRAREAANRDAVILERLERLEAQSGATATQVAETREWVRELVGELRRRDR